MKSKSSEAKRLPLRISTIRQLSERIHFTAGMDPLASASSSCRMSGSCD